MLKLSLPAGKVVWALAHPVSRDYIHQRGGAGYQECRLIVTERNQPVEVTLEDYPKWAQNMIISSINIGDIINTGSPIPKLKPKETVEANVDTTTEVEKPKATKKKASKRSRNTKDE